jgi:electron transport complex protein RnfD
MPSSPPYVHTAGSITRDMLLVVAALVPAIAVQAWSFGWGVVINIAVAAVVALAAEALMLRLRGRPVVVFLRDGSALVTALLLAVCLPPLVPWWLPAVGAAFAIIMAKHLYGGLGNNVFNPAMVGYVVLLIAFPPEMTTWLPPMVLRDIHLGFAEQLQFAFAGQLPTGLAIDAITMATPLDHLQNSLSAGGTVTEIMAQPVFGNYGGPGWGMVNIMLLLGGLALLATRVITWHVPVGLLGALGVMAGLFHGLEPDRFAGPGFHVFTFSALLGAFFIATDPVSGAASGRGRLVFGAGVGVLVWIIRTYGSYADGMAFGVLLMNIAAPTIDHFVRPRVYGHREG